MLFKSLIGDFAPFNKKNENKNENNPNGFFQN